MTDNATHDDVAEEFDDLDELDDLTDDLAEGDDAVASADGGLSTGAVSGGFGFAGLALALVSLTTNWTSGVVASHAQYVQEVNAPSSGLTEQQQLNMYAAAWHTEGWWALWFAVAAVLFGVGALLWPTIRRSGRPAPGWAKAAAASAAIVGVVLAVLTIVGVFGGHLVAPASAS
jgi:hypothetical protein